MRETDRGRREHMYDAARFAYGYARERGRRDFDQDLTLTLAVVKLIEIVGEAASKVSADGRAALPEIRWDDIIGMRNRLIHAYYDINRDIVWETATQNLPPLIRQLERALGRGSQDRKP